MTQPNPNDGQGDPNAGKHGKAPAVKLLDVVKFPHHDIITGRDTEKIGVVVRSEKDAPTVAVRALEHHYHEVDPAELSVITAADYSD